MYQRVLLIADRRLAMAAKLLASCLPRLAPSVVRSVRYTGHFDAPRDDDTATIAALREFEPDVLLFFSTEGTLEGIGDNHRQWVKAVGNLPSIYVFEEEGVMDAIHDVEGIPWRGFHFTLPEDYDQDTLFDEILKLLKRSAASTSD
jgi:hypothetical protein